MGKLMEGDVFERISKKLVYLQLPHTHINTHFKTPYRAAIDTVEKPIKSLETSQHSAVISSRLSLTNVTEIAVFVVCLETRWLLCLFFANGKILNIFCKNATSAVM